jgi:L-fucose mutarotase/ribose pyranase (RbsD/FucU family)
MAKLVTKVHSVRFHRNGISGAPFYVVHFDSGVGKNKQTMLATIFFEDADPNIQKEYVAVIDLAEPTERWRGADEYGPELNKIIAETDDAEMYARP